MDEVRVYVVYVMSSLSVAGSLFIIGSYLFLPDLRTTIRRIVLYLGVADLLEAGAFLLPHFGIWCQIQYVVSTFGSASSFIWSAILAFFLFLAVKRGTEYAGRGEIAYHLVAWGYPAATIGTSLAFINGGQTDEPWCFVKESSENSAMWRLILVYGPLWASLALVVVFYCCSMYYYQKLPKMTRRLENLHSERRLFWIPFVFFFLRIWGSTNRLMDIINPTWSNDWLDLLQAIGDPGQGFVNALLYGLLTKQVRKRCFGVVASFMRHPSTYLLCKCCCRDDDDITVVSVREPVEPTREFKYSDVQDFEYTSIEASDPAYDEDAPRSGLSIVASPSFSAMHGNVDDNFP